MSHSRILFPIEFSPVNLSRIDPYLCIEELRNHNNETYKHALVRRKRHLKIVVFVQELLPF